MPSRSAWLSWRATKLDAPRLRGRRVPTRLERARPRQHALSPNPRVGATRPRRAIKGKPILDAATQFDVRTRP
jgi:hypothetical protein